MKILTQVGSFLKSFLGGLFKLSTHSLPVPLVGIFILLAASAWLTVGFTRKYPDKFGLIKGPAIIKKEEDELIAEVRAKIDLPENERPTIATVTDKSKVENQTFFTKAQNGDRVLIYSEAKKVVLYRPSEGKVVEIGAVNISGGEGVTAGTETEAVIDEEAKITILNGTEVQGLTNAVEDEVLDLLSQAEITQKGSAQRLDYSETLLIDLVGKDETAKKLAEKIGARIASLPGGETRPEGTDFLIIVGQDRVTP